MRATSLHQFLNTEHQVDFNSKHVKEVYTCKFGGFYRVEDVIKCLSLFSQFADLSSHKRRMFSDPLPPVSSCSTWSERQPGTCHLQQRKRKAFSRNRISASDLVLYTCVSDTAWPQAQPSESSVYTPIHQFLSS